MKKIIILAMFLFFIVGCNPNNDSSGVITERNIHVGTEGLVLNFADNMPPSIVYGGDTFPVSIRLENKGAYDILDSYLVLNLEKDLVESRKVTRRELDIKGKSFGNPNGDTKVFNFPLKAKELGKQTETITSNVLATVCYKYRTTFEDTVCVDTDYYNQRIATKACGAEDKTYDSGQGSPVSITKVEPKMMEEDNVLRPVFLIYIKNMGTGGVISSESVSDACSDVGVRRESIDKIDAKAYLINEGKDLNCRLTQSQSTTAGEEQETIIRCVLEDGIDKKVQPYSTVLRVVLDYGYTETISRGVEIRKV